MAGKIQNGIILWEAEGLQPIRVIDSANDNLIDCGGYINRPEYETQVGAKPGYRKYR